MRQPGRKTQSTVGVGPFKSEKEEQRGNGNRDGKFNERKIKEEMLLEDPKGRNIRR